MGPTLDEPQSFGQGSYFGRSWEYGGLYGIRSCRRNDWNDTQPERRHGKSLGRIKSELLVETDLKDVSIISRAPLAKIEPFKQRMGWSFKWLSSGASDFNFDYYVSFTPEEAHNRTAFYNYARTDPGSMDREGISAFYKDESGAVFHTYSCYARGIDMMNATYQYLDLTPRGRDEDGLEWVQAWVRHHDRYKD